MNYEPITLEFALSVTLSDKVTPFPLYILDRSPSILRTFLTWNKNR